MIYVLVEEVEIAIYVLVEEVEMELGDCHDENFLVDLHDVFYHYDV